MHFFSNTNSNIIHLYITSCFRPNYSVAINQQGIKTISKTQQITAAQTPVNKGRGTTDATPPCCTRYPFFQRLCSVNLWIKPRTRKQAFALSFSPDNSSISRRSSALLTDAIRTNVPEDMGYNVDMIEFIDFEHSQKNILIRARHTGKPGAKRRT